jgi:hypothetical protein
MYAVIVNVSIAPGQFEASQKVPRNSPPPPGVTFNSVEVREVVAEA